MREGEWRTGPGGTVNRLHVYRGVTIYPTVGRARINGYRWEVLGLPGRPFTVLCETLAGAREVIRDAHCPR